MSDETGSVSPPLQFDTAQPIAGAPAAAPMVCTNCKQAVSTEYYEAGGQVICANCRTVIGAALAVAAGKERFILATVYGGAAALVGALIWWGVRAATGYEIGLVAVAVGLLVGFAVRAGSQGRGGRRFQVLAVALTYLSITLNYVPLVIKGLGEQAAKKDAQSAAAADGADPSAAPSGDGKPATPAQTKAAPTVWSLIVFVGLVVGIAAAAPFLAGSSNVIGILIIGFALWEAWKVNRGVKLAINGPFRIGTPGPP